MQVLGGLIIVIVLAIILPWWVIALLIGGAMMESGQSVPGKAARVVDEKCGNVALSRLRSIASDKNSKVRALLTRSEAVRQRAWEGSMACRRVWAERFGAKGPIFYDDSYDD